MINKSTNSVIHPVSLLGQGIGLALNVNNLPHDVLVRQRNEYVEAARHYLSNDPEEKA